MEEGKVQKIQIIEEKNGKKDSEKISKFQELHLKMQTFFAFPLMQNKVFNLKDFEQGIDQMNRLQSNNATLDIKPAEDKDGFGYSDIYILNKKSKSTSIGGGIDNNGNKSTGENSMNIFLSQDNLLSVNDNIYLKYTQDTDSENSKRYNKAFYGNMSIPLGYWTLNSSLNYSKYLTSFMGNYSLIRNSGETIT